MTVNVRDQVDGTMLPGSHSASTRPARAPPLAHPADAGEPGARAGLVLGNLRLPLVVLLASSPAAGAGANVAVSGAAAVASAATHASGGRVNWRLFAWMAPPSLAGGIVGGVASGLLPDRLLLAAIGLVVLYGAVEVVRYRRPVSYTHLTLPTIYSV